MPARCHRIEYISLVDKLRRHGRKDQARVIPKVTLGESPFGGREGIGEADDRVREGPCRPPIGAAWKPAGLAALVRTELDAK